MNSCNTNIPGALDAIAHGLGGERSLLGYRNIAGACSYHGNRSRPPVGMVPPNSDQTRHAMPLSISSNVSHLTEHPFVCMSYDYILRVLHQTLDNADDLAAGFAGTEHDFGKPLTRRARMVD